MSKPWHEDREFWRLAQPFLFTAERWQHTPKQVSQIVRQCGMRRGMRVLDLCCGTGRISLELARRGYDVTGVDSQDRYLREARKRARRARLRCRFLYGDMRTYRERGAFDVVLSIFTSFGYFRGQSQNLRVLKNIYASLKPGGKLCMELMSRERLRSIFTPKDWEEVDGTFLLEERSPRKDWRWMENRWIFLGKGRVKEFVLNHHLYGRQDLSRMLRQAGFRRVRCSRGVKRLVVVAQK